jgi:acetyl esterase/lipase
MSRTARFTPSSALLLLVLIAPHQALAQPAGDTAPRVPANLAYFHNVEYRTAGKETLHLDIAYPKPNPNEAVKPLPAVLLLHGAGPLSRKKVAVRPLALELAQKGYVSVAINYRLRPQGEFLAPIHDAKAAVRWLRLQARGGKYPIDADRIGAVGYSGGSALACLLGMTTPEDGLEDAAGPNLPSSRVQAVVGYFGPADMTALHATWVAPAPQLGWFDRGQRQVLKQVVEEWVGGPPAKVAERYSKLSPISYVRKEIAPLLLMHGTADAVVPVEQSKTLAQKLKGKKAPVNLLLFDDAPHDFDELNDVNARLAAVAAMTFLQEHLGKR